jgi:hypothetical protein
MLGRSRRGGGTPLGHIAAYLAIESNAPIIGDTSDGASPLGNAIRQNPEFVADHLIRPPSLGPSTLAAKGEPDTLDIVGIHREGVRVPRALRRRARRELATCLGRHVAERVVARADVSFPPLAMEIPNSNFGFCKPWLLGMEAHGRWAFRGS